MLGARRIASSSRLSYKRQRLSSPTYDDQLGDLSQADLDACEAIEAKFAGAARSPVKDSTNTGDVSQSTSVGSLDAANATDKENVGLSTPSQRHSNVVNANPAASSDDDIFTHSAPFKSNRQLVFETPTSATFVASKALKESGPAAGFASASALASSHMQESSRSPSPEAPPERDYTSWFESKPDIPTPGSETAAFVSASSMPMTGFMKASDKGWVAPSVEALAKAEEKMKRIWQEGDSDPPPISSTEPRKEISVTSLVFPECSLNAAEPSLFRLPESPSPASFGKPTLSHMASLPTVSISGTSPAVGRGKSLPFKSPLLPKKVHPQGPGIPGLPSSPLNPSRGARLSFPPTGFQNPISAHSTLIPSTNLDKNEAENFALCTPSRSKPVRGLPDKPKFITPFKPGMKPGEPGRATLKTPRIPAKMAIATGIPSARSPRPDLSAAKQKGIKGAFDLSIPETRQALASSGLIPQISNSEELEALGINAAELAQITPNSALYYSFHTISSIPLTADDASNTNILGPSAALNELLSTGCPLATKPWIDNHWCLILWKMAGMACLDPKREANPSRKIWCWPEAMRQLLYRYERELNGGSRPPLRRIAAHDSPASLPMVLCVSNVTWSEAGLTPDGLPVPPKAELEVTDGWYRLRAQVDAPLSRAIKRGLIRVGRKIAIAGAKLWSERKEPAEILDCYNSTKLVLSGNASHLAPWHAKLGFQMGVSVATLNSLTADGGVVALLDIVVIKTYPLAFIEFFEGEDGEKRREGPRVEKEENQVNEEWKKRRELEASKLRADFEKKISRMEGYAGRLEQRAGFNFTVDDGDSPPDRIESLYDDLGESSEPSAIIGRLNATEAGWLARFIHDRLEQEREKAGENFETELQHLCPPRDVRNFRVVIVQDARTQRKPAHRVAQVTVWDALSLLDPEESNTDTFQVGRRFKVSNLIPTQQSAWMDKGEGSEVYLSTRRDSRWTLEP